MDMPVLRDEATLRTPEGDLYRGELILTREKIIFVRYRKWDFLIEKAIGDVNPDLVYITPLNIPDGLRLSDKPYSIQVPFSKYWKAKILEMREGCND